MSLYKKIEVIINPSAGRDEPILNVLNDVFSPFDLVWDVSITHKEGDATRMARRAVGEGADLVVGYGGDGTQMEVVNGLIGTGVPLGILPGGTGNAMAFELGIPRDLASAARVLCTSTRTSGLDVAKVAGRAFLLRAYTGPEPQDVASREEKDRLGLLAYPLATLRVLSKLEVTRYRLTIDGEVIECEGLACFVFNAGSVGGVPAGLPGVSAQDGLLDVFVWNRESASLAAVAGQILDLERPESQQWRGKTILIEADPPQPLWLDGEVHGATPCTIELSPQAIQVVTANAPTSL